MATGATRNDDVLTGGLQAWWRAPVAELARPAAGFSSETVVVTLASGERRVVRLPLLVPSYPSYDLRVQQRVLDALASAGVPAPRALALVDDPRWLGAPFLVMSFVEGRPVGDVPALDPWLAGIGPERQRGVHERFLVSLAAVHDVDWRAARLDDTLRVGLDAELDYWRRYVDWAAGGSPARALAAAVEWCAATAPCSDPGAHSLLWGDARLGNVLFDEHTAEVTALLDWELASIGPAEMDLAWYLALDELTTSFVGRGVPGFLSRREATACYERALGREVANLEWHEVFALVRSVAINDRQARLAAAAGTPYPGVPGDANPVLAYLDARIAAFNTSPEP